MNISGSANGFEEVIMAYYDGSGFSGKSKAFLELEEKTGEAAILDAVRKNTVPVHNGKRYPFNKVKSEDRDLVVFIEENIAARYDTDIYGELIETVKNYVTNVSMLSETLYGYVSENGGETGEISAVLDRINRDGMTLWQKFMFIDLLREYCIGKDKSLYADDFFDVVFIAEIFAGQLTDVLRNSGITVSVDRNEEDIFGKRLNFNHLRIILSLAVREILCLSYKPEYIYISVKDNKDSTASVSVSGGTMNRKPTDTVLNKSVYASDNSPVDEFVSLFCKEYGCTVNKQATEDEYTMTVIMPAFSGAVSETDKAEFRSRNEFSYFRSRFSAERIVLNDLLNMNIYKNKKENKSK